MNEFERELRDRKARKNRRRDLWQIAGIITGGVVIFAAYICLLVWACTPRHPKPIKHVPVVSTHQQLQKQLEESQQRLSQEMAIVQQGLSDQAHYDNDFKRFCAAANGVAILDGGRDVCIYHDKVLMLESVR